MTAIGDFCGVIRNWLNYEDYSDDLITSWVRMAEEQLSEILRCKHMIAIDTAPVAQQRVLLPLDWQDLDFVRDLDGGPLLFRTRDEFYRNPQEDPNRNKGYYTITGNYLIVGGPLGADSPRNVELAYYENIPPLGDETNWLMKYYSRLYITATLSVAAAYSIEDSRAVTWQAAMADFVNSINENHLKSKASGSKAVKARTKGFG